MLEPTESALQSTCEDKIIVTTSTRQNNARGVFLAPLLADAIEALALGPAANAAPGLDALQRAFGFDRDFRIAARGRTPGHANLLVTRLVAGDFDVLGI